MLFRSTPTVFKDSAGTEIGTLCRAWVNFNGTGTVAIRGSFNVSSITDNGTGDYTVNFTNAMTDANYSITGAVSFNGGSTPSAIRLLSRATGSTRIEIDDVYARTPIDTDTICVSIFR